MSDSHKAAPGDPLAKPRRRDRTRPFRAYPPGHNGIEQADDCPSCDRPMRRCLCDS